MYGDSSLELRMRAYLTYYWVSYLSSSHSDVKKGEYVSLLIPCARCLCITSFSRCLFSSGSVTAATADAQSSTSVLPLINVTKEHFLGQNAQFLYLCAWDGNWKTGIDFPILLMHYCMINALTSRIRVMRIDRHISFWRAAIQTCPWNWS